MLFLTHLLFGILTGLIAKDFFSEGNFLIFFCLVLFGAILPDLDERESKIAKWAGILGRIFSFFSRHRGFFHSLFLAVLLTLISKLFFGSYYAWGLFLGLVSHLIGDSLTKQGLNPFYPFGKFKIRGGIKTGGLIEIIFSVLLGGLIIWKLI